ncbi:unnamed protein product [Euphydryas editha]|uniref:Uncharacterized protein n=1 Tax=Euphydryas editha TaxID=104508 RepID=A0AAU9TH88_EUPED|nr:unnamed protein product [Euphydryas editha]
MYRNPASMVRTGVGETNPFPITVGVQHMLSRYTSRTNSVAGMYPDNMALVDEDRLELERRKVNPWKSTLGNSDFNLNEPRLKAKAELSIFNEYKMLGQHYIGILMSFTSRR